MVIKSVELSVVNKVFFYKNLVFLVYIYIYILHMNCCTKKILLFLSLLLGFNNIYSSDSEDNSSVSSKSNSVKDDNDQEKDDNGFVGAWNKLRGFFSGVVDNVVKTVKHSAAEVVVNTIKDVMSGGPAREVFLGKIKSLLGEEAAKVFLGSPVNFLNYCVFSRFECDCEADPRCKTDEHTGVHYREFGDLNSDNYVFFFHGMLYKIDNYDLIKLEKAVTGSDLRSYHFVSIEYNSFHVGGDDVEQALGFSDIDDLCRRKVYPFIKKFLEGKNPNKVIFVGHSHGNTYAIRVYAEAKEGNLISNVGNIGYLGCKGYLNFEETLATALSSKTLRKDYDFINLLLPEADVPSVRMLFTLLAGADNYEKIRNNNDNEGKINELIEKKLISDIVNHKLSKPEHYIKPQDFLDMFGALNDYTTKNPGRPLPVLLFYADEDEYVGEAFKKEVKVNMTEEELETKKAEIEKNVKKEKEISVIVKEIEDKFKDKLVEAGVNQEELKEVYNMKTGGIKAFKGLRMSPTKSGSNETEGGGRRCCNSCRCGNRGK